MGRSPSPLTVALVIALVFLLALGSATASARPSRPTQVRDGPARFQVLTPTLIRLEYAGDREFEDRPTLTVPKRRFTPPPFETRIVDGTREIRTSRLVLRYEVGSGPFDRSNLRLRIDGARRWIRPSFPALGSPPPTEEPPLVPPPNPDPDPAPRTSGNLSGWYRGLDNQSGPVPLHDGLLSRDGWYLLDDTTSPLLVDDGRWYRDRRVHSASYQDGYLFAYGDGYAHALGDLRTLTGPAPLLPRKAFGNWFSRYQGYSDADYIRLLEKFRSHRVPLDVLVVDTDYKSPHDWNGWQWTPSFFPDPPGFVDWAHSEGLDVILNVHPSISGDDPGFEAANGAAGGLIDGGERCRTFTRDPEVSCGVWDWARRDHVASYFSLHEPFEAIGADSWWLDWCCDESRVEAAGLTPDTWINSLYARRERDRGRRWLPLSRIGASFWDYAAAMPGVWAEHRDAIHFTGDTFDTWKMLDFQTRFTVAEGAGIGLPYVSHDIGSFHGAQLPDDMYVRWVQLGAFQPILRLHSDHAPRLPWEYSGPASTIAGRFLRLRESLVPYLYTVARQAYDTGLPLARAMYLRWPDAAGAYRFDRQYMLGDELLVAPVGVPGDPARKRVWFPPGEWVDIFTGRRQSGPAPVTFSVPLERMPVFARAGAIVPTQPYADNVETAVVDPLLLDVYAGANGSFDLYEDSGDGFGYQHRGFARTPMRWTENRRSATLAIGPSEGHYPDEPGTRRYSVRIVGIDRPQRVTIGAGRHPRALRGWDYDADSRRLTIDVPRAPTRRATSVTVLLQRRGPAPPG